MRIKTISISMIFLLLSLILLSTPRSEAATSVSVTIPTFKVRLNDVTIDNGYSQYPLIVYKDITYFPMTYYDSRFMGLESLWGNTTGLEIVKTGHLLWLVIIIILKVQRVKSIKRHYRIPQIVNLFFSCH